LLNILSESVKISIEDIHFILGPNITSGSPDSDFGNANSPYDSDMFANLKRMFG
jgi:hypothetical protein